MLCIWKGSVRGSVGCVPIDSICLLGLMEMTCNVMYDGGCRYAYNMNGGPCILFEADMRSRRTGQGREMEETRGRHGDSVSASVFSQQSYELSYARGGGLRVQERD